MPTPARNRISGRPMPMTSSRAWPPPSGSLGMSPSDCTISRSNGIAAANSSTMAEPPLCCSAPGAGSAGAGAASTVDDHTANSAPQPTTKIASGRPNRATRSHCAPRMATAAIGTGDSTNRPWLAEIASASAIVALCRLCGLPPPIGRSSGVMSAKAAAGEAARPAIRPKDAAIQFDPSHRQRSICAMSRSDAAVVSARPAIRLAATITRPGE